MARPITLCLSGLATLALFGACGGVADPGLFSPSGGGSGLAGSSGHGGGESTQGGEPGTPTGGAVGAGASGGLGQPEGGSSSGGGSSSAGAAQAGGGGAENGGASSGGLGNIAGSSGSGAAGSAGSGGGSAGGSGSGGSGGELTCAQLFAQANKQLEAARSCNLAMNVTQCTGEVNNLCGCEVPVQRDSSAETKAYLATLKQIEKQKCSQICPAIACFPVNHAQCKPNSQSGLVGTCVSNFATPL